MAYTTVNNGSLFMNPTLYTGTGSTQSITGVNFQPDLVWLKKRSAAGNHYLFDVVRGAQKNIHSNENFAEVTEATTLTAFGSDGFTLSTDGGVNQNGATFASWNWLANGAGSANTDGYLASTVSVNTTSGFSIVKYLGNGSANTVGHGLGVVPKMIIVKNLNTTDSWFVYHVSLGASNQLKLNETEASSANQGAWNNTSPTSALFTVGNSEATGGNGRNMIAYCFAEKQGYSKFGSYTGNGDQDGTFVYTGFKPAFVILKNSTGGNNWIMKDSKRPGYNVTDDQLYPDANYAEDTNGAIDLVSNGFKTRTNLAHTNGNGSTYIYMAFAEAPLVGTNNIPANAR